MMMDVLPIKFRSPPPKPPRKRNSDQLSSSSASPVGKQYYAKCPNDNQQEASISSSCSLPSNWTNDFSLNEKNEKSQVLKKDSSLSHIEKTLNFSVNNMIENYKNCLGRKLLENNDHLNNPGYEFSYNNSLKKGYEVTDFVKKDILELMNDKPNFNNTTAENFYHFELFVVKNLHKRHHRRHFSDPLPFSIENSTLSNEQFDTGLNTHRENRGLLLEIKALKDMNNKLWEHLCSLQAALDLCSKSSSETFSSSSPSDILSSIYDSLKVKENAMEDRIKVLLQERNGALQDLNNIFKVLAKGFEDYYFLEEKSSDKEINEILKEIELTNSPHKLLQQQRLLLAYLYKSKQLKQEVLLRQLKVAASEKNNLLVKVNLLEEELHNLKLSNEIKISDDKFWEKSLLNALCQVIQQRDASVKHNKPSHLDLTSRSSLHEKYFESEEINHSSQKMNEGSIKVKNFKSFQTDEEICDLVDVEAQSDQVKHLMEDILILNKSLEIDKETREGAEEKNMKSSVQEISYESCVINECLQKINEGSPKLEHIQSYRNDKKNRNSIFMETQSEEVNYLKEEILILNRSLEIEKERRESAEAKNMKLERLVNVLQKKLHGQNVGVAV